MNGENKRNDLEVKWNSFMERFLSFFSDSYLARICAIFFLKALNSLRSHTDPIRSGEDCRKLKGFGNAICMKIDQKFAQKFPNSQNVTSQMVKKSTQMTDHFSVTATKPSAARERVSKNNRKSNYIPAKGSSAFAILIALLRLEMEFNNSKVNKLDLKETAQHYCKANFGLMTINSLLQRSLIIKTEERNCRYSLSDQGRELAKTLALASENLKGFVDVFFNVLIIKFFFISRFRRSLFENRQTNR